MKIKSLSISDLKILSFDKIRDCRGYFFESYRQDKLLELAGEEITFVQENISQSELRYTVRGLHMQLKPKSQGKLVECAKGKILDVCVDVRKNSDTFGQCQKLELSAENALQLWVPPGFLHGFVTLEPDTQVRYKCTDYYAPELALNVLWNDPELKIDWGFDHGHATLSDKDLNAQGFNEFDWDNLDV